MEKVQRRWMLGSEEFRKELLERMSAAAGPSRYGTELRESEEEKASRIIAQEIQKLKFPTIDLDQLSNGDARKIEIARRLRQETTMPLRWIAERLQTGSVPYTAKLIRRIKNRQPFSFSLRRCRCLN